MVTHAMLTRGDQPTPAVNLSIPPHRNSVLDVVMWHG